MIELNKEQVAGVLKRSKEWPEEVWMKKGLSGLLKSFIPNVDGQKLQHGLYRIYWKDGGNSLASVGSDASGTRWFAPTNWAASIPCNDWSDVERVELLEQR